MIPSNIVAECQAHDFQDILDTRIYPLLTAENRRLCGMKPWPFTERFSTWTEVVGTAGAALPGAPTDIRAIRNLFMPGVANNDGNLQYLRRDYIEKIYGGSTYLLGDTPIHYNLWGKNSLGGGGLYVYPYHTISTIYALDYHALPPVLSAASTEAQMLLPDAWCTILIDRVVARLSQAEGDLQDAQHYFGVAALNQQDMEEEFDVNLDSADPMLNTSDTFFDGF